MNQRGYSAPELKNLCYSYFVPEWNTYENKSVLKVIMGFLFQLTKILLATLKSSLRELKNIGVDKVNGKILIIVGTLNHKHVLQSFESKIQDSYLIADISERNLSIFNNISMKQIFKSLSIVIRFFWTQFSYENFVIFSDRGLVIYQAYLTYFGARHFFQANQFNAVIVFNDHVAVYRAITFAAQKEGVKTIYIPHASVSEKFPPLHFDYALLEGQDMREKYSKCGISSHTEIKLVGNAKMDKSISVKQAKKLQGSSDLTRIGLAYNLLDELTELKDLISELLMLLDQQDFKFELIIRPHPRVKSHLNIDHPKVVISEPYNEDVYSYFERCNILLATNSNIILESLICGVPVIPIASGEQRNYDNYGFIRNGLIPKNFCDPFSIKNEIIECKNSNFIINETTQRLIAHYDAAEIAGTFQRDVASDAISQAISDISTRSFGNLRNSTSY